MTKSIGTARRRGAKPPPLVLVHDGKLPGPYSDTAATLHVPSADPHDVLATLTRGPVREPIATGTPLDSLAADRVGARAVVVLLGEPERGKTALALATAATVLRAGGAVVLHAVDRDPRDACSRLARLVGCELAELSTQWRALRVRTGPLSESRAVLLAMGAPVRLLVVDSLQAAAHAIHTRRDAAPTERVEAVLAELRQAALDGALVVATSERAPSGGARHSHAVGYAADVLAKCDRDAHGRFSLDIVKPHGRGARWFALDPDGRPVDVTAATPPAPTARKSAKRRRSANPPAPTDEELRERVAAVLESDPTATVKAVCERVGARWSRTAKIVTNLKSSHA